MAHEICFFDMLPVEILYNVFIYLLAHEILYSFSNISDYIDGCLLSYSCYQFDLRSIQKRHFDMICRRIKPEQVISLILSDDKSTPGQSELFFSYFQMEQFTRLRSLMLYNIEVHSTGSIMSNSDKLNQLRSFSFKVNEKTLTRDYSKVLAKLPLPNIQLHHLIFTTLKKMPLEKIRCLTLEESTINELQIIFSETPQLRSLNVCLIGDASTIQCLSISSQLIRLTLNIKDSQISMDQIEHFLPNLFYLKHFELQAKGHWNLADACRWQKLTNSFITFNFMFALDCVRIEPLLRLWLRLFQTSFWLEEKHWYVAYDRNYLFSVPHFARVFAHHSCHLPVYSTAPNDTIFYDHISELLALESSLTTQNCFNYVKQLTLICDTSSECIWAVDNLNQIQNLSLFGSLEKKSLISYLNAMPRLQKLSIHACLTFKSIEHMKNKQFEHIRTLEIHNFRSPNSYFIEELSWLFPKVERLHVSNIESRRSIVRFINRLKYLSNASFFVDTMTVFNEKKGSWFANSSSFIGEIYRFIGKDFTYQFDDLSSEKPSVGIHLWIGERFRWPYLSIDYWSLWLEYFVDRLMLICLEHPGVNTVDILRFVHVFSMISEYPYGLVVQFIDHDRQTPILNWLGRHASLYALCALVLWKLQLSSKYIVNIYIFLLLAIIIIDIFYFSYHNIVRYTVAILALFFSISTINSS